MSRLTKKQKIAVLLCTVVLVCGIGVAALCSTGVLSLQTKGAGLPLLCHNPGCSCHIISDDGSLYAIEACGQCETCRTPKQPWD